MNAFRISPLRISPLCPSRRRRWLMRSGTGLVELLIGLAITGLLLTATAVALHASTRAYAINQEQATLMQHARIAMNRIITAIRTAKAHAPEDATLTDVFASGATVVASSLAMVDDSAAEPVFLIFRYDQANKRVLLLVDDQPHVLAQGVEEFHIRMEPKRSATSIRTGGSWDLLRRASVVMTIRTTSQTAQSAETTGQQTVTLSASVAPRRNTW